MNPIHPEPEENRGPDGLVRRSVRTSDACVEPDRSPGSAAVGDARAPKAASWESALNRELRNLPDRPAPRTLIPRVMAALQTRAGLPWYRRPWWDWSSGLQALSLLGLSGLLGLATWLAMHAGQIEWMSVLGSELRSWLAPLSPVWSLLSSLAGAVALVLRGISGWICLAGGAFCVVMYLSCVGLGTAFYRVACYRRNP